ncbi:MAG: hypothetical protein ACE5GZ_14385, partial [Gammaproteobacteria bacterium]
NDGLLFIYQPTDSAEDPYHLNIIPELVNERVHVGSGSTISLRATGIRWDGPPAMGENQRWKNYPVSDWKIYKLADGASSVQPYRQYELLLDLDEIGLRTGVPFPARFEVETDPATDEAGRFQHRNYLGKLGSENYPIWFVIAARE